MPASRIENLGQIMGLQLKGPNELVARVRKGLTPGVGRRVTEAYGISQSDLARIVHVTAKTIQRQQVKGIYNPVISDALFRLADVFARAKEVFGNENEAREWMHEESTALGNVTPWSLLDTAAGEDMVIRELGRIEHGIVS
jgi:putative toxin-antitoxin system antitoxin component (TIGR02293 family)